MWNPGKEMSLDEIRNVQIEILNFIDEYCSSKGLRYFLAYGTLIGAVRHNGYIPWDDDIDIVMPRDDYERLVNNFNDDIGNGQYKILSPLLSNSIYTYSKIIDTRTYKIEEGIRRKLEFYPGVDVDVLPLDTMPRTQKEYQRMYRLLSLVYLMHHFSVTDSEHRSRPAELLAFFSRLIGYKKWNVVADWLLTRNRNKKTDKIGVCAAGVNYSTEWHDADVISDCCMLAFEEREYPAPIGYHKMLQDIYGDYMEMPPEKDRVSTHKFKAFWKEDIIETKLDKHING